MHSARVGNSSTCCTQHNHAFFGKDYKNIAILGGFPGSTRLLELAHTIEEMKTICTCGRKATCNCRKVNGEFVFEGEQVAIDLENDVQYVSMCPQCYFRERRAFYARRAAK